MPISMTRMLSSGSEGVTTGNVSVTSGNMGENPDNIIGSAQYHREQRRKRTTGFATLKRKLIRRRRSSKVCDHARVLRDFVSDWKPLELAALCEEFEALSALRDLSVSNIIMALYM